jgi:peptidoglycan hydrolase-like protein with peptidoglycan-binding domain
MPFSWDDLQPGDFKKTTIDGGLAKLVRIWEYLRDLNEGGYGSGVLADVKDPTQAKPFLLAGKVTSCSPFTATCVYMALDPRPVDTTQKFSLKGPFQPQFDGGRPLGPFFYRMHNSYPPFYYANGIPSEKSKTWKGFTSWKKDFKAQYVDHLPVLEHSVEPMEFINHSAGSIVAHNLGEKVEPEGMRRGDVVGIDWHDGGGHAVFCWNVHLDKDRKVDCFQLVSSNGTSANGGAGITVFRYGAGPDHYADPEYLVKEGGKYTKKKEMFSGVIDDPRAYPEYNKKPYWWYALPGVKRKDIDVDSFGGPRNQVQIRCQEDAEPTSIDGLHVARLFGVTPPEPYLRARESSAADATAPAPKPKPLATARSKPVEVSGGGRAKTAKQEPQKAPPGEAEAHQVEVEMYLQQLWTARWVEVYPGDSKSINDAESQAAIKTFQQTYMKAEKIPQPGHADPATRKRLALFAGWALGMPMVNLGLRMLHNAGELKHAPGVELARLDDATRAAVKEFQEKKGLDVDGIPGTKTQRKLVEAMKEASAKTPQAASGEKPSISSMYVVPNHGKAGDKVTVVVLASKGCEGKSYSIGLFQGDKALLEKASQVTIAGGKGRLEVQIPSGPAPGARIEARLSGDGVSAKSAVLFEVVAPTPGPADPKQIRSSAITVAGKDFVAWFNGDFQPKYMDGKVPKMHPDLKVKKRAHEMFPNKINGANFKAFFDHVPELMGRDSMSLLQFLAAFCIPYNETGGRFVSTIEKGGGRMLPAEPEKGEKQEYIDFGPVGWFFWSIPKVKSSYNTTNSRGRLAGDQLQKMGLLSDPEQIEVWNGRGPRGAPVWSEGPPPERKRVNPLDDPRYPNPQTEPLKSAQKECDFYKYRGRGFTQTTGREGYQKFVDPALVAASYKKSDDLTNAELDAAFGDARVYVAVFHNELVAPAGPHHDDFENIDRDEKALATIGDRIAGTPAKYGAFYAWRCREVASAMEAAGWSAG